jgi:hypothetical protein
LIGLCIQINKGNAKTQVSDCTGSTVQYINTKPFFPCQSYLIENQLIDLVVKGQGHSNYLGTKTFIRDNRNFDSSEFDSTRVKLYIFIHNEVRNFDKNLTQPEIRVNRVREINNTGNQKTVLDVGSDRIWITQGLFIKEC